MRNRLPSGGSDPFWSFVAKRGPRACWIWTGPRDGSGYGRAPNDWGGTEAAHRVAYRSRTEYEFGRLRHTCGNRACVNPRHLEEEEPGRTWDRRFWSRVARRGDDECWDWTGARTAHGYGVLHVDGRTEYAHRLAWGLLLRRRRPHWNDVVGHTCGNRACVNPRHLIDHVPGGDRLDEDDVEEIRRRHAARESQAHLASVYQISPSMVSRVVNGSRWRQPEPWSG